MFQAFALSEKIHGDNYKHIIETFGSKITQNTIPVTVNDTKSNVLTATKNEIENIKKKYPYYLRELEKEAYEEAIMHCMYSWKSHRQHEKKIRKIQKYSGSFFSSVASQIEEKDLNFHVCEICGSTLDKKPSLPCIICNKSLSHYQKINRPA